MSRTREHAPFALALLAATCLTPVAPAQAAPGDRLGTEFQVNTTTADQQQYPVIAMDADGDFVVVWNRCHLVSTAMGIECIGGDIFAQRYNAAGEPKGTEFLVNTTTAGEQWVRSVAMDADGDFVVVWHGYGSGSGTDVFAQRFDATGAAQGAEFQVNGPTDDARGNPSVAMDADGDFVVAWESIHCTDPGCLYDVSTRRFDSAGLPKGGVVRVDEATLPSNKRANVAMDAAGNYVLVWQGYDQTTGSWSWGIFAQRYNAAGQPQGGVFRVNATTADRQLHPSVAMDADGDFVVTWHSHGQDGDGYGVFAQRFDAAGNPQGGEFQVNATATSSQSFSSVAMDADGDFVVLWSGYGPGDNVGVFAQRYDSTGEPQGGEVRVNSMTAGMQGLTFWHGAAVAMDADGDFVAAWQSSDDQDGDGWGIFAQRFQGAERVAGDFDGDGKADLLWRNTATGTTIVWLMDGETRLDEGAIGAPGTAWRIAGTGDFNGDGKADILWRHGTEGSAVIWQMNGLEKAESASIGKPPLAWSVEQIRDTDGDGLSDIVWRHAGTGTTLVWRMSGFTKVSAEPIGSVNADWQLR